MLAFRNVDRSWVDGNQPSTRSFLTYVTPSIMKPSAFCRAVASALDAFFPCWIDRRSHWSSFSLNVRSKFAEFDARALIGSIGGGLASDTKAPYCFVMIGIPNRLAGLKRLDCSNGDAL